MKNALNILIKGVIIFAIVIIVMKILTFKSYNSDIDNIISDAINIGEGSVTVNNYEEFYNAIEESIVKYDSNLIIKIKKYDESLYKINVIDKVLENNHQLGGVFKEATYKIDNLINTAQLTLNFEYNESKDILLSKDNEVKNKVEEIVNEVIKPEMKDYEKEKALHDYVINNCRYDKRYFTGEMPNESYTAYGVLINGVGVCQGYAVAMDMLLKEVGIETNIIVGEAFDYNTNEYIPHAWNIVKIGGQYYHLDLTWDDPIMEDGSDKIVYSYFNIKDDEIEINHKWNKSDYPKCIDSEYSFINLNFVEKDDNGNDIVGVKNYDEFFEYIKQDILEGRSGVTYRISDFDGDVEYIKEVINSAYESLEKSGEYYFNIGIDDITKCGYITVVIV